VVGHPQMLQDGRQIDNEHSAGSEDGTDDHAATTEDGAIPIHGTVNLKAQTDLAHAKVGNAQQLRRDFRGYRTVHGLKTYPVWGMC
jgi:hypothetical protein